MTYCISNSELYLFLPHVENYFPVENYFTILEGHIFRKKKTYLVFQLKVSILYLLQHQNVAHNNMGKIY